MKPDSENFGTAELLGIAGKLIGFWLFFALGGIAILAFALWLIKILWAVV